VAEAAAAAAFASLAWLAEQQEEREQRKQQQADIIASAATILAQLADEVGQQPPLPQLDDSPTGSGSGSGSDSDSEAPPAASPGATAQLPAFCKAMQLPAFRKAMQQQMGAARSAFVVHNFSHQGRHEALGLAKLGLPAELLGSFLSPCRPEQASLGGVLAEQELLLQQLELLLLGLEAQAGVAAQAGVEAQGQGQEGVQQQGPQQQKAAASRPAPVPKAAQQPDPDPEPQLQQQEAAASRPAPVPKAAQQPEPAPQLQQQAAAGARPAPVLAAVQQPELEPEPQQQVAAAAMPAPVPTAPVLAAVQQPEPAPQQQQQQQQQQPPLQRLPDQQQQQPRPKESDGPLAQLLAPARQAVRSLLGLFRRGAGALEPEASAAAAGPDSAAGQQQGEAEEEALQGEGEEGGAPAFEANWMRAALASSDLLLTVSGGYAAELLSGPQAAAPGFEGTEAGGDPSLRVILRARGLRGILNGVDSGAWSPVADPYLPRAARYDAAGLEAGKAEAKRRLQRQLGLREDPSAVLLAFVGRLEPQKGADVVLAALPRLLGPPGALAGGAPDARLAAGPAQPQVLPSGSGAFAGRRLQLLMLGQGQLWLEDNLRTLARAYPGRAVGVPAFEERLAHLAMAAADFLLVPSRFEPCGLVALCAQRYGTLPIAAATGGLPEILQGGAAGFLLRPLGEAGSSMALRAAVADLVAVTGRAVAAVGGPEDAAMRAAVMAADVGWDVRVGAWEQALAGLGAGPPGGGGSKAPGAGPGGPPGEPPGGGGGQEAPPA
jgi:glycosyltransferase involved in cell wall biosynthesis